jgi:hypothetical protein
MFEVEEKSQRLAEEPVGRHILSHVGRPTPLRGFRKCGADANAVNEYSVELDEESRLCAGAERIR